MLAGKFHDFPRGPKTLSPPSGTVHELMMKKKRVSFMKRTIFATFYVPHLLW